jgi:hypothetical protein
MKRLLESEAGVSLIASVVAALLLGGLVYALVRGFSIQQVSGVRVAAMGGAYKSAVEHLYRLMDLPWSSPELAVNTAHSDGDKGYSWTVTPVPGAARMVKIEVRANFRHLSSKTDLADGRQGIAVGYKYDDF